MVIGTHVNNVCLYFFSQSKATQSTSTTSLVGTLHFHDIIFLTRDPQDYSSPEENFKLSYNTLTFAMWPLYRRVLRRLEK